MIFFKAWSQLGGRVASIGYFDFMRPEYSEYKSLFDGDVFGSSLYTTPAFSDKYTKRFGHQSYVRAGHFYDMTNITIEAAATLYAKLGHMPTHEELLAEMKRPKELPNLVVGSGRMTASGWVESHYVLRQVKDCKVIDYVPAK